MPSTHINLGLVVYVFNSHTGETETGGFPELAGHLVLLKP